MRLRIHENGVPHEEGVTYLSLVAHDEREVIVAAVDESGEILLDQESEWHGGGLLTITDDGHVALSPAVMPSLGFDLDVDGRVRPDPYGEAQTAKRAQRHGGKRAAFRSIATDSKD